MTTGSLTIADSASADHAHDLRDDATERLFPLRLTPFERYMLLDGESGWGMVFTSFMDVEGVVDRAAFEAAVAFATSRHPLFRATVVTRWLWKYWSLAGNHWPQILWVRDGDLPEQWRQPPDLSREPGLLVMVQEQAEQTRITARFHHSCTDGVGAAQWLDDMMVQYARLTGAKNLAPEHNEVDARRLIDRGRDRWPISFSLRSVVQSIQNIYTHLFQLPRPLAPPPSRLPEQDAFDLVVQQFSGEETATLRRLAHEHDVSLNAWLLCDLFRAIARWNEADDNRLLNNPWYRICMPISLRHRADAATPATNIVGLTFLQRRRKRLRGDRSELLRDVEQECRDIKRLRRGTLFLRNLRLISVVPGLVRAILSLPVCYSTMTLTNLGDPNRRLQSPFPLQDGKLAFGNLVVSSFGGSPPLTRYLHATISVNTYRERLTLNLQMAPDRYSRTDAERFMHVYVGELHASLDSANT